nr:response regulator [Myxococcota bacterium]
RLRPAMAGEAWLILPTYNEAENLEPLVRATLPVLEHAAPAGIRILVVDDEADARAMLDEALSARGAHVVVAASAPEAIAAARGGRFDVVVSDIGMPHEDGYMFIRALRALAIEEGGGVPAIALTAYSQASDRARALRSGFQLHLAKPAPLDELARAVLALARPE